MAWPGNFNWDNRGSGVDHAPPPPPPPPPAFNNMGPFANPEFWQRCFEERGGWDEWNPEHHRGPHDHGHGFGRRGGRRHGGRRGHGPDGEGHHSATDNDEFPPEYIDDDEVAEAVAHGEKGQGEKEGERDGSESPDTLMRELTPTSDDPPEGVPSEGEECRQRGGPGRHGRHGSFGRRGRGRGPHGRGEYRRHGSGPHGFQHHGPPPPPFFGAMFGGGPGGDSRGPPPLPPFLERLFGAAPGPRGGPGGPHGHHPHGPPPPPPPPFEGLFGAGPGHRHGPGSPGPHGAHGPPPPPPPHEGPAGAGSPFDFQPWMAMLANHPFAKNVREYLERAQSGGPKGPGDKSGNETDDSFTPPLDLFEQADKWVLHMAVPGAKKEDIGVSWDADRSVLAVSGVVHRPGDEEFIKGLISSERSTGLFSREIKLPPAEGGRQQEGSKEEVNAEGIVAKMEDGVLMITVPKVEKGWTEVKKVDIQ